MIWPFRRRRHEHLWDNFASFKRRCECGREEWMFMTPYPMIDRPGAHWRDMTVAASGTLTEGGDVEQAPGDSLSGPTLEEGDAQGTGHD